MLIEHYSVQVPAEAGVSIACLSDNEQTFVMVSNAVIEKGFGSRPTTAVQRRTYVVENAVAFIMIANSKRVRFRPSTNLIWILLRDIPAGP